MINLAMLKQTQHSPARSGLCFAGVEHVLDKFDKSDPNCVVVGDAQDRYSYANLNKAFQILVKNRNAKLITLGNG